MSAVFFTGFPGFLGRELLPRVLARRGDARAVCLVQARFLTAARQSVAELEAREPSLAGRISLLEGDITLPDLGVGAELESLADEVDEVYHLAAVYDLAVAPELAPGSTCEGPRTSSRSPRRSGIYVGITTSARATWNIAVMNALPPPLDSANIPSFVFG